MAAFCGHHASGRPRHSSGEILRALDGDETKAEYGMHVNTMRSVSTLAAAIAIAATACERDDVRPKESDAAASPQAVGTVLVGSYADTASIRARVDSIEKYVAAHPDRLKLYATVTGQKELVAVKDTSSWPDFVESSYNIVVDSANRPLLHVEVPTSESGDWHLIIKHYFDPKGRTILYHYNISGFSSGCTEILRENRLVYVNPSGGVLSDLRSFTDADGKPIDATPCYRRSDDAPPAQLSVADLPFPR